MLLPRGPRLPSDQELPPADSHLLPNNHEWNRDKMHRKIAVNTGGGDAPGLNAVIRAVVLSGINEGWEVYGIRYGFGGILDDSDCIFINNAQQPFSRVRSQFLRDLPQSFLLPLAPEARMCSHNGTAVTASSQHTPPRVTAWIAGLLQFSPWTWWASHASWRKMRKAP